MLQNNTVQYITYEFYIDREIKSSWIHLAKFTSVLILISWYCCVAVQKLGEFQAKLLVIIPGV